MVKTLLLKFIAYSFKTFLLNVNIIKLRKENKIGVILF